MRKCVLFFSFFISLLAWDTTTVLAQATPSPTCVPRPACLDAQPACLIAETPDMCPPPGVSSDCPTNLNLDQFRSAFFTSDSAFDLNHDGIVDLSDYSLLVNAVINPCTSTTPPQSKPTPTPTITTPAPTVTASPALPVLGNGSGYVGDRSALNGLFASGSWNIPAKQLAVDPNRVSWVSYFYNQAVADHPGNINVGWREYTYPIFIAKPDTKRYVVSSSNPDWGTVDGKTIPYDPTWAASIGTDAQIIVIDPQNQNYFDLWQVKGVVNGKVSVSNGSIISNYTKSNGINLPSRGTGIAYFAMLVTPEEVNSGVIRHALSMTAKNTGPSFVPPAIKSDGGQFGVAGGIPEGTRFALTMTDAQIDAYVKSKPANLQKLARVLAVALRDYGWVITDSSGNATLQLEDYHTAGNAWEQITGITGLQNDNDSLRDLLDGIDWLHAVVLEAR